MPLCATYSLRLMICHNTQTQVGPLLAACAKHVSCAECNGPQHYQDEVVMTIVSCKIRPVCLANFFTKTCAMVMNANGSRRCFRLLAAQPYISLSMVKISISAPAWQGHVCFCALHTFMQMLHQRHNAFFVHTACRSIKNQVHRVTCNIIHQQQLLHICGSQ